MIEANQQTPFPSKTYKYFAYVRVSTQRQGVEGVSLEAQQRAITEYASRKGLIVTQWFEERETAAKRGRPVFNRMLSLLRKGKAQGVIMHKIDRSARNLKDWADLGELVDLGIDVHFAVENYDLRSRGGRLSADIQAVVAADYIRNLREEVKKGFYGRIRQGRYPMPAPVGYADAGKGIKELDPTQAPLVRMAFELYATGNRCLEWLVEEMYRRGLRGKGGGKIPSGGMSYLLNNPFYLGLIRIKRTGEIFPGVHPPLISKALFDQVHRLLTSKTVDRQRRHFFIFSRLVRCRTCSYSIIGEIQKGYTYYRCQTSTCPQKTVREELIEGALLSKLDSIWFPEHEEVKFRKRFEEFCQGIGDVQERHAQALKLCLDQINARLSKLADGYLEGILKPEVIVEKQNILFIEKKDVEEQIKQADQGQTEMIVHRMEKFLELAKSAVASYKSAIPEEKRALVKLLTSNREVEGKNVVIELNFPFSEFENCQKVIDGGPHRGVPRTFDRLLERLWEYCAKQTVLLGKEGAL